MQIERKLTVLVLAAAAVSASLAFAQVKVAPVRAKSGAQDAVPQAKGAFDAINMTPMQDCLTHLITWKQSLAHEKLGGSLLNWDKFSDQTKAARTEVTMACNMYLRATLSAQQQEVFDRTLWDVKTHPLPQKWETVRQKGTQFRTLLTSTSQQQTKAKAVTEKFLERQHEVWGFGHKNGGYTKNFGLLEKEFRAILTKDQLAEFNPLWTSYSRAVDAAVASMKATP